MTSNFENHVLVGVDGSPASDNGVTFAAAEARRRGVALHVVHATPGHGAYGPPLPTVPDGSLRSYGIELLEGAAELAHKLEPDLEVRTSLIPGGTVASLVAAGEHAALLVLGAERRTFIGRIWTGDVVAGVAARATCPVTVVPPEWDSTQDRRRVVVGLKSVDSSETLLAAGLALAHEHDAELVVLHAWKLQSGYDDIITTRVSSDDYVRDLSGLIEPVVEEAWQSYPEVPVRVEVLHGQPAFALVDASAGADRLLISRPKHGGAVHHLGAVARAVLQEARCPLEILPPT